MVVRLLAVGISKSYFVDYSIGLLMWFSIALLRRRVGLHRLIDARTLKKIKTRRTISVRDNPRASPLPALFLKWLNT